MKDDDRTVLCRCCGGGGVWAVMTDGACSLSVVSSRSLSAAVADDDGGAIERRPLPT